MAVSPWTAEEERHESSSAVGEMASHQRPQVHQMELVAPKAPEGFSRTPLSDFGRAEGLEAPSLCGCRG